MDGTPTYYKFEQRKCSLVYLVFDYSIVSEEGCLFCDGNAAISHTLISNNFENISNFDWDTIFSRGPFSKSLKEEIIRKRNAEMLSKKPVSVTKIIKIFFNDINSYDQAIALFPGIKNKCFLKNGLQVSNTTKKVNSLLCSTSIYSSYSGNKKLIIENLLFNPNSESKSKYSQFYAVMYNTLTRGSHIKPSDFIEKKNINSKGLDIIYAYQILILSLIKNGEISSDPDSSDLKWIFNSNIENDHYFKIACESIFKFVGSLCTLAGVSYIKPNISYSNDSSIKTSFSEDFSDINTYYIHYIDMNNNTSIAQTLWIEDTIFYNINPYDDSHKNIFNHLLNYYFNLKEFRPNQLEIIASFLNGNSTIGILPTGGGKSLTYYFAVLLQPKMSIVVVPINALMKDQANKLLSYNINSFVLINNEITLNKKFYKENFESGNHLFTFINPERLQNFTFRRSFEIINSIDAVGTIVLDEVHCLSEWGHDFRISYLMTSDTIKEICKNVKYLGLTATAQPRVINDLMVELSIDKINIIYNKKLRRDNLEFSISKFDTKTALVRKINKELNDKFMLDKKNAAALIFSQTIGRNYLDELSVIGLSLNLSLNLSDTENYKIGTYYGGAKDDFEPFMKGGLNLMIATKAFGMGIDKPNIRLAIHAGMTSSRESFYQEAGRAGRDGELSKCMLFSVIDKKEIEEIKNCLNVDVDIDELKALSRPRSRKLNSDVFTSIYFFSSNANTPECEAHMVSIVYEKLIETNKTNLLLNVLLITDEIVTTINKKITNKNFKEDGIENLLYILHKVGVIKNWTINYPQANDKHSSSNSNQYSKESFCLELFSNYTNLSYIKKVAINYIESYGQDNIKNNDLESIKNSENLKNIILIVRKWYYDMFVRLRLEQIINMYDFVNKYANKENVSEEIQTELDKFFDLTEILDKTEEGYSLEFAGSTYTEVTQFAFSIPESKLQTRAIECARMLENTQNYKTQIYTSLIYLRNGKFNDRNGKGRLESVIPKIAKSDKIEIATSISKNFVVLNDEEKIELITVLLNQDEDLIYQMYENNQDDKIISLFMLNKYNKQIGGIL
jgi:ATP-dependent DNA helicase RecQ